MGDGICINLGEIPILLITTSRILKTMTTTQQKYAFITGASSGIGYAMAEELSQRGYQVFGCSPKKEVSLMEPLVKKYGLIAFDCDITKIEDIQRAKKLIGEKTGGRLDILYNNAGIAIGGPACEIDEAELNTIFQINVIGHINVTKHMADYVIAAKGTIVFTSSVATIVPLSWIAAYNSTKAAINMYAKTLHAEMKPFGVKVYSVITGGVNTAVGDRGAEKLESGDIPETHYNVEGMLESVRATALMSRNKKVSEEPAAYAKGLADKITNSKNYGFNLYKGGGAYTLYLLTLITPLWLLQLGISLYFKQQTVFRNIRKAQLQNSTKKLK